MATSPAHLIFSRPPHAGGAVNLVFGGAGGSPSAIYGLSEVGGVFGHGSVWISLPHQPVTVSGASVLGGIVGAGNVAYTNRNPLRVSVRMSVAFQPAATLPGGTQSGWDVAGRTLTVPSTAWGTSSPTVTEPTAHWQPSAHAVHHNGIPWATPQPQATRAAMAHQAASARHTQQQGAWQTGEARSQHAALVHQAATALMRSAHAPWQFARTVRVHVVNTYELGKAAAARLMMPWQVAGPIQPGHDPWPPVVPVTPPRVPSTHLLFACPAWSGGAVHIVFGHVCGAYPQPLAPIYILPARFYMAIHSLTAHLLPSNEQVPIYDVSLFADSGSTVWTFSASAPAAVFDALTPTNGLPRQIMIALDGMQWVFVVDSLQRSNQFGQRSTKLAGRSATALLGSPYSRETARLSDAPYTAQQLAEQALDLSGVALDWGIDDWLVPAGAWSHTGTPLAAVQAIAEAAGGYVNSHRSAATLLVRHPYPTLPGGIPGGPWNWGGAFAPDVELAPDSIITSSIERKDGPNIDGVYVSGTTQGILAHVKRTGTAGANLGSMITDDLITATIAAQQRGLSVLGAAGAKHLVQINLPILTGVSQPGVLDVGQLVQINETTPWRGRVRAVSVQGMAARQSVTLERHL